MRPEKLFRNLLAQPFGPYLEETVLSDKCKFVQTRRLLLEDFQLAYNNEPTGFDRTEFDGDSTPLNVAHLTPIPTGSRVLFRGVLSVTLLSHLSDKGLRYLNHDLQQRITMSSLNGVKVGRAYAAMDIESIFALKAKQRNENVPESERYGINVLIQGYMHLSASFMRSDLAADGLLFHSANATKNKFRIYQILSMDIETYKLSRTFLFRHHTLSAMRNILKYAGVPAHKCTPQWFLDQYLLHHAYPGYIKWQRMNFLEGVGSSDEGSSNYLNCPPDAQTHRPRHLRKVHKNEVWSIFVSHSEWILSLVEKHKDLKGKVNTQSWRIFLLQVSQLRERAMLDEDTEGKWGLRDEQGLNQIGKTLVFSSPLLLPVANSLLTTPKNQKKKKGLGSTKPVTPPIIYASTASPSKASLSVSQAKDQFDNIYDSDFTQGTLSPTSHYTGPWIPHSDAVHTPLSPPDPSLYALIPKEMFVAPPLPADLLWHCPVGGGTCSYIINMSAPSDDNLKLIKAVVSQDDIIHLLEKEWKSNDEQVYMVFYEMVNEHWEDHLKELDIKHVQKGDASTFEWIHPQRHKPWPPPRWKLMRARRQQLLKFKTKPESPEF